MWKKFYLNVAYFSTLAYSAIFSENCNFPGRGFFGSRKVTPKFYPFFSLWSLPLADGVADGGMPTVFKERPTGLRDRTWPRAEPMAARRTPGRAVPDSDLLGTPEWSAALHQVQW